MTNVVVGNIIALIAAILMVVAGWLKSKKKILFVQTMQISLNALSNLVLKGITGAIVNMLCAVRNILCYKNKLSLVMKIIFSVLFISLPIIANDLNLVGILPIIGSVLYVWLMNTQDIIKFKTLILFNLGCWLIYDIYILSYTSAIFDLISMFANVITIIQLGVKKNENICNM